MQWKNGVTKQFDTSHKEALLEFIQYDCILRFRFPTVSLNFIQNTGLYTPIYSCSLPIGQLYFSDHLQSSTIQYYPLKWVFNLVRRLVFTSENCHKTRGVGGLEWVSAHVREQCDFGMKYLLCRTQSRA